MTSKRIIQNIGMRNRIFLLLFINNLSVNLYFLKTSSEIYFFSDCVALDLTIYHHYITFSPVWQLCSTVLKFVAKLSCSFLPPHFEKKAIRPKRKRKSVDNTAVLWYNGSITMKKERSQCEAI